MRMAVSGALPTTANIAAMPTTANAAGSSGVGHTCWTNNAKPVPIDAPMKSDGMKAPPEAPDEVVRLVATAFPMASTSKPHHTTPSASPRRKPLITD